MASTAAATADPQLFSGPPECRVVVNSMTSCIKRSFQHVGNLISMSLTQDGPGPKCFTRWMYSYICFGMDCTVEVTDIPDQAVSQMVDEVIAAYLIMI